MTNNRKPISLLASVALGLGAALLILVVGGHPAAAAPAAAGDSQPAPIAQCYARNDSATLLVYSSADSAAVRQAVLAALPNDTTRLAGTCAGVAAGGGTTQTVLINKVLTLVGGYSISDWAHSYPITQPTTLDAQSQGRVITTSAELTISALTVQHGYSGGGSGGGIYANANLTFVNPVMILSNTTLLTPTLAGARSPAYAPQSGDTNGGGVFALQVKLEAPIVPHTPSVVSGNSADNGGGIYAAGQADLANVDFTGNTATLYGGAVYANATLHMNNAVLKNNSAVFGGAIATFSGATLQNVQCDSNTAIDGGCWTALSENQVNGTGLSASNNTAFYGGFLDAFGPFVNITSSRFNGNTASVNGGVFFLLDSSSRMANDSFIVNTLGSAGQAEPGQGHSSLANDPLMVNSAQPVMFYAEKLFSSAPIQDEIVYIYAQAGLLNPPMHSPTGSVNPLASSTAPTGSAFFASGVTLFITDTIIAGFATDLATDSAPSSTIVGDYNLFDHTPVISGTGITTGTHSIVGNPMFADALGHLNAGSPAIDHGIDVGINVDLDGNHRPSGAGFDIGAYEFQAALIKLFLPLVRH